MKLTPRHTATLLAALRIYQEEITNFGFESLEDREQFTSIGVAPMSLDEIDDLCEEINLSSNAEPFTEGEWHTERSANGEIAFWDSEENNLLHSESDIPLEQREANARLMVKAPRLKRALDCLLEQTVDQDLAHGISLTEGQQHAREQALAIFASLDASL